MSMPKLAELRKAIAALTSAVAALTAQGLVSGTLAHTIAGILGAIGVTVAVFAAPENRKAAAALVQPAPAPVQVAVQDPPTK